MQTVLDVSSGSVDLCTIDISAVASPDPGVQRQVGAAIRLACQDHGFFYVSGHGIPQPVIDAAFASAARFFALPTSEKSLVSRDNSFCFRGYDPMSNQTLEAGTPPDLKEGFNIGVDLPLDDIRVQQRVFGLGPNQWPASDDTFRVHMQRYLDALRSLGVQVMRGIALSLDLPLAYFDQYSAGPLARIKLLHYPPQPAHPQPDEKGCGAHTDFGGITILAQDEHAGLQVFDQHRGWFDVAPLPGTFVVNLGDMMVRWTNDRYRSALHRVINISGRERYSIPYFLSGDPDFMVSCLPSCHSAEVPARYTPITVIEHFKTRYAQSYE